MNRWVVTLLKTVLLWVLAGLFPAGIRAVEVDSLYVAEVPVKGQSAAERSRRTRQAMQNVIVRVSSGSDVVAHPRIQASLGEADRFLTQFSYVTRPAAADGRPGQQYLRLQFDGSLINRLLRDAKLPIWGTNRPNTLVWLIQEEQGERHIVSGGEQSPLKTGLLQQASQRGLPLLFPLMDLEDQVNLSATEAWGLFRSRLETASARYDPEAILAGRVYRTAAGTWTGRWLFLFQGQSYGFNAESEELASYPADAINTVADFLASHYAVATGEGADAAISIWVTGVNTLGQYARVTAYLEKFALVNDASVAQVEGDRLRFNLSTGGTREKLSEAISLDDKLVPAAAAANGDLVFAWKP